MFKYLRFDFDKTKKFNKFKLLICSFIIIILLIISIVININNDIKEDVKIISSNSRRIISDLTNYTETMSDFLIPDYKDTTNHNNNNLELDEIKKIKLTLDYFKEVKDNELKQLEIKKKELKDIELKQQELKELEIKKKELDDMKMKAINLIKSYIPDYHSLINLISTHSIYNVYQNNNDCLKQLIKINNEKLFEKLIHIDYDKSEVSFNYLDKNESYYQDTNNILTSHLYSNYDENGEYYNYSHYIYKNYKENIIKNPIYINVKEKLEIDYSYTEPDLTEEYNNKSLYFQQSLNDFNRDIYYFNNPTSTFKKYYENYSNDTKYLYYKYPKKGDYYEFLINNEIIINNKNSIDIYNKHSYKFKCGIPSRTMNNKPIIKNYYSYSTSSFNNFCGGCYRCTGYSCRNSINENNIESILNVNYDYNNDYKHQDNYNSVKGFEIINTGDYGRNYITNFNKYTNELELNKGSRMVKHNLTNNIPELKYGIYYENNQIHIGNYYFIEKVFINFPMISIYDEYNYIKLLISEITDIYNLPIIPPIKFI